MCCADSLLAFMGPNNVTMRLTSNEMLMKTSLNQYKWQVKITTRLNKKKAAIYQNKKQSKEIIGEFCHSRAP